MNDLIRYICREQYSVFGIPVRIFKEGKLLETFDSKNADGQLTDAFARGQLKDKFKDKKFRKPVDMYVTPSLLAFGYIYAERSGEEIILGPCRTQHITEKIAPYLLDLKDISRTQTKELVDYLNSIPLFQSNRFTHTLCLLNACLNGGTLDPAELSGSEREKSSEETDGKANRELLKHNEQLAFLEIGKINYYDYEFRLLHFIENGMTETLKSFWKEPFHKNIPEDISKHVFRKMQNDVLMTTSLASYAAMNGGVDAETAYALQNFYSDRVEQCNNAGALINLRYEILVTYCERVHELHYTYTGNPTIDRAIQYINENVAQKFSAEELAQKLHINTAYFCVKFKELTGTPLTDFIQQQKVREAKYLLRFSSKTLAQISSYLSFSSQSYFQKVFKRFAGVTPKEYRNYKQERENRINK